MPSHKSPFLITTARGERALHNATSGKTFHVAVLRLFAFTVDLIMHYPDSFHTASEGAITLLKKGFLRLDTLTLASVVLEVSVRIHSSHSGETWHCRFPFHRTVFGN